jgi:hypothetical protein
MSKCFKIGSVAAGSLMSSLGLAADEGLVNQSSCSSDISQVAIDSIDLNQKLSDTLAFYSEHPSQVTEVELETLSNAFGCLPTEAQAKALVFELIDRQTTDRSAATDRSGEASFEGPR